MQDPPFFVDELGVTDQPAVQLTFDGVTMDHAVSTEWNSVRSALRMELRLYDVGRAVVDFPCESMPERAAVHAHVVRAAALLGSYDQANRNDTRITRTKPFTAVVEGWARDHGARLVSGANDCERPHWRDILEKTNPAALQRVDEELLRRAQAHQT